MSHIDEALRMWERASSVEPSDAEATRSARRTTLSQYPREGALPLEAADTSGPNPPLAVERGAPPTQGTLARSPEREAPADLEARLVTGASSAVSHEQYRRLAAALHDAQVEQGLKTVMVASALPEEGKTLTAVNLALTLSESYERRVLIIDADLRWPSVHTLLGLANERGLSEALLRDPFELSLREVSSRLSVMTAGQPGPAPLAALTSERMRTLLDQCGARFDWVLLDTSPVGLLPDAQVLARLTGAVIFVIGAGSTPAAAVERAVADLGPDCIIGTVLNRVDERRIPEAGLYDRYMSSAATT
jgi:protein-tyrosine kinase